MTAFLIYIAKAAIALTLLYSLYGICLRRESFHSLNRAVLMLILVASVALPFIRVESSFPTLFGWMTGSSTRVEITDVRAIPMTDDVADAAPADMAQASMPVIGWAEVLFTLYIIGVVFFALRYLLAILRTVRTIRQASPASVEGGGNERILMNRDLGSSCSWLHWVLLAPADVDNPSILTHERAHIRLGHSYDKVVCEVVVRLLWFVPFGWMLREDLSDIHEYEADRAVLDAGFDVREYCLLLIHRATHPNMMPVVNAFNESKTKQRMARMFQPKSSSRSALKALYLLPLATVAIVATAEPKQEKEPKVAPSPVHFIKGKAVANEAQPLIVVNGKVIDIAKLDWTDATDTDLAEALHINPEDIESITVLKGATGKAIWGERGANGVIQIETKLPVDDEDPAHEVFIVAEEPAEFVGGSEALMQYLSRNTRYPSIAIEHGVQGTVHVEFIVQKDGEITNVKATLLENPDQKGDVTVTAYATEKRTPHIESITQAKEVLKASAVAMVRNMPDWKPARQRGQPVRMKMSLPITYRLQ
ncbi:MAG: energy transducer TonB [Bacteroidaceae bacterium]|nr:energy transducer TonB [Bacteroidaceae bacterium]